MKKLPKFEAFAGVKARRRPARQSVPELRAMAARWHAALSRPVIPR